MKPLDFIAYQNGACIIEPVYEVVAFKKLHVQLNTKAK